MAKRRRLTPADPSYAAEAALETKAMFPLGVARRAAPIADVARDSSAAAALEEMTQNWAMARQDGRLVIALPHDDIKLDYLQRDRMVVDPEDMLALKQSLSERGQQAPVEVVALPGDAGYGLLSGWRRCQALRALHVETGEARFAVVQALLRRPEDAADAYRSMVEENEIRANLSHYERARVVIKAVEAGVFDGEEQALTGLFGSVPRARRSKIRSFLGVVQALDGAVRFPEKISERSGLELAQRLREDPALTPRLRAALAQAAPADALAEQAVIAKILQPGSAPPEKTSLTAPIETVLPRETAIVAEFDALRLQRRQDGALVLSGGAVTDAFVQSLVDWLGGQHEA